MDFRNIEIFLAICAEGSLSAAAKTLGVTQAAVSQRMAQLERDLRVPLMDRQKRPIQLTPAGAYLRERGGRLIAEIEDIAHAIDRFRGAAIPELRIGIVESVARALMPRLVPRLHEMVGRLSIVSGTTSPLVPDLVRGDLDIIVTSERVDEVDGLERHTLIEEPFILVFPKNAELPASIADLPRLSRTLDFVRLTQGRVMARMLDRQLSRYSIDLPRSLEFASTGPIVDLIRNGLGWAVMTPLALHAVRADPDEFAITMLPELALSRQLALLAKEGRHLALPAQVTQISRGILQQELMPVFAAYPAEIRDRITIVPEAG